MFLAAGKKELYDLANDLGETKDLAAAEPAVVVRLTALMQRYIDTGRSTPGSPQENAAKISLTGQRGQKRAKAEPE